MTPGKMAILAVFILIIGVLVAQWAATSTEEPKTPAYTSNPSQQAAPQVKEAKLQVMSGKMNQIDDKRYEITYVVKNVGNEKSKTARVVIYPYRLAVPFESDNEEPVDERHYGWSISIQDSLPPLRPNREVTQKVELYGRNDMDPTPHMNRRIQFEIPGHPQN